MCGIDLTHNQDYILLISHFLISLKTTCLTGLTATLDSTHNLEINSHSLPYSVTVLIIIMPTAAFVDYSAAQVKLKESKKTSSDTHLCDLIRNYLV